MSLFSFEEMIMYAMAAGIVTQYLWRFGVRVYWSWYRVSHGRSQLREPR